MLRKIGGSQLLIISEIQAKRLTKVFDVSLSSLLWLMMSFIIVPPKIFC
jgi:hypothetical protein